MSQDPESEEMRRKMRQIKKRQERVRLSRKLKEKTDPTVALLRIEKNLEAVNEAVAALNKDVRILKNLFQESVRRSLDTIQLIYKGLSDSN
jgi:hypothetical protein